MAITINGTANTIAGLAVGGLPDGTVDADTLASGAAVPADGTITEAKLADGCVSALKHKANAGSGAIIQVKSTSSSATTQYGSTSSYTESAWITITELAVSITPTASTSKIHIAYNLTGEPSENEHRMRMRVKKAISGGATTYINAPASSTRALTMGIMCQGYFDDQNNSTPGYFAMPSYVDSPATTSAVTYTLEYAMKHPNVTFRLNGTVDDDDNPDDERAISQITVMEIA